MTKFIEGFTNMIHLSRTKEEKEQILKGKMNKFIKENTLLGQSLITDPKNTVSNYLAELSKNSNLDLNITSMDLYTI